MVASDFKYRHQFWILLGIYLAAFACWPLDRRDVSGVVTKVFPPTALGAGLGFVIAAVLVAFAAGLLTWSSARTPQRFAIWLCWAGFGVLLNRLGLFVVVVGVAVLLWRVREHEKSRGLVTSSKVSWERALPIWVAAVALAVLALTLKESLFFLVIGVALLTRIVRARGGTDKLPR